MKVTVLTQLKGIMLLLQHRGRDLNWIDIMHTPSSTGETLRKDYINF